MESMFEGCTLMQEAPLYDTSKVTNLIKVYNNCNNLQQIGGFTDTSKVTNMTEAFRNCNKLLTIPSMDTSNVTIMNLAFGRCGKLTTIEGEIDMNKVTSTTNMFVSVDYLVNVKIKNLGISLDLSYCKVLSKDSLLYVINNAKDVNSSPQTLKVHSKMAGVIDENTILAFQQKGWTYLVNLMEDIQ